MPNNDTSPTSEHELTEKSVEVSEAVDSMPSSSIKHPAKISLKDLKEKLKIAPWKSLSKKHKVLRSLLIVFLVFTSATIAAAFYTSQIVKANVEIIRQTEPVARQAYANFKSQNIPAVEQDLNTLQESLNQVQANYNKLSFYKFVPLIRQYYLDAGRGLTAAQAGLDAGLTTVQAVSPYADVLGFSGEGSFTGGTAEDRLKVILDTVDKVTPELDKVISDLEIVEEQLNQIDPNRYPEQIRDYQVRSYITEAQEASTLLITSVTDLRPVIEQLPDIAGARGERKKYLILFENDNELRPTGGFMTAYAIINVENGKVEPEKSDDIYELDQKFRKQIPIPEELGRYLTTERYLNLRDMNISPDFKTAMDLFYENYQGIPGEPEELDGIIAVDTEFLTDLLSVLGPVEVPGYGTFGSQNDPRCDCPQIIYVLSEIITRPTPYIKEDRKGILGPLMRSILTKAYTAPKQSWPALFQTTMDNLEGRHIQAYFLDEEAQKAAESAGAAGRMLPKDDQDFVAIINANLGGAKSNLFTEYEVEQTVSAPENGMITKTLTITYKNTRKGDNCNLEAGLLCLNATLQDWTRIYVPAGSQLIDAQGFTEQAKTYDEAGFTVIDGFFKLEPLGTAKLRLEYQVPYQDTETYNLEIWKQGGIENYKMLLDVNGSQEEVIVDQDQQVELAF